MTKTSDVARCYARAIFELAEEKKVSEMVLLELQSIADALSNVGAYHDTPPLFNLFRSPVIGKPEKKALLERLFGGGKDTLAKRLLYVLIDRGRTDLISTIVKQFEKLLNESKGFVEADVYSAREISEELFETIRRALERKLSKKVVCKTSTAPELIGGIQVRIGNRMIDGSIRTKLNELHLQLHSINKAVIAKERSD